jgi:predicted Zn-dependent protease
MLTTRMKTLFLLSFVLCSFFSFSQTEDLQLADEYYQNNDFEKARDLYEKLSRKSDNIPQIHRNYLAILIQLNEKQVAEKYLKKVMKEFPVNISYKLDYGYFLLTALKREEGLAYLNKLISESARDEIKVRQMAQFFQEKRELDFAQAAYLEGRKYLQDKKIFSFELANIYMVRHDIANMLDELMNISSFQGGSIEYVKNSLHSVISKEEDMKTLEKILITRTQSSPNQSEYPELLIWLYVQQKNFSKAFFQARAIDKRLKMNGEKVYEIGNIAIQNKSYEEAIPIFEYVIREYPKGPLYVLAKNQLINSKEEQIKKTFPVNLDQIKSLISDYQLLYQEIGPNASTAESLRNMALLYAFYFDKRDTAIAILQKAMSFPQVTRVTISRFKLDLGDVYLLKEEPWESTLLYSQVEKSEKDQPLGHEAKLRNAKLNYYKGDFKLAQSHLDILKMATSREIANDAMDLSLLIQDNTGLDSSETAMKEYALIDLLLFQNKKEEALYRLENMLVKFPGHSLQDEIYYQMARIFLEIGNFQKASENLTKIRENFSSDIYGDDALFLLGKLQEENFKNKEEAAAIYQEHLFKYPGSIYTAEARKRLRKLRGDQVN